MAGIFEQMAEGAYEGLHFAYDKRPSGMRCGSPAA
jgi:hypothetical protein